jgi:hypothetical protein
MTQPELFTDHSSADFLSANSLIHIGKFFLVEMGYLFENFVFGVKNDLTHLPGITMEICT